MLENSDTHIHSESFSYNMAGRPTVELRPGSFRSFDNYLNRSPNTVRFAEPIFESQRRSFIRERVSLRKAFSPGKRSEQDSQRLPRVARATHQSFSSSRCMKADQIIEDCERVERRPEWLQRLAQERKLLKKYSDRMDWTMQKVTEHCDLDDRVLHKLLEELAREKFEEELTLLRFSRKKQAFHA